jgi:hypothetical protein
MRLLATIVALLLFSCAANAKTCVWVDYDNSPAATMSGRIITHHKLPKGGEQRTGDGPWPKRQLPNQEWAALAAFMTNAETVVAVKTIID